VVGVDRLGPDVRHAELAQRQGGEHARLDVGADAHHGMLEVCDPKLAQGLGVAGVGLNDMGQPLSPALDQSGVLVDGQTSWPRWDRDSATALPKRPRPMTTTLSARG
jgi:hypothetical protein